VLLKGDTGTGRSGWESTTSTAGGKKKQPPVGRDSVSAKSRVEKMFSGVPKKRTPARNGEGKSLIQLRKTTKKMFPANRREELTVANHRVSLDGNSLHPRRKSTPFFNPHEKTTTEATNFTTKDGPNLHFKKTSKRTS